MECDKMVCDKMECGKMEFNKMECDKMECDKMGCYKMECDKHDKCHVMWAITLSTIMSLPWNVLVYIDSVQFQRPSVLNNITSR